LRELGWVRPHGRNWYRWAGRSEQDARNPREFVRLRIDVIVTGGSALAAAKQGSPIIPIVFAISLDPLGWHGRGLAWAASYRVAAQGTDTQWAQRAKARSASRSPLAVIANIDNPAAEFADS
jgi:hypothetical protein